MWNCESPGDNVNRESDLIFIRNFICKSPWIPRYFGHGSVYVSIPRLPLVARKQEHKVGTAPRKNITMVPAPIASNILRTTALNCVASKKKKNDSFVTRESQDQTEVPRRR